MIKVYEATYEKTLTGFGLGTDVTTIHKIFIPYNLNDESRCEILRPLIFVLKSDHDAEVEKLKEQFKVEAETNRRLANRNADLKNQIEKAEKVISDIVNSKALKEAPFYGYCEDIANCVEYLAKKGGE